METTWGKLARTYRMSGQMKSDIKSLRVFKCWNIDNYQLVNKTNPNIGDANLYVNQNYTSL